MAAEERGDQARQLRLNRSDIFPILEFVRQLLVSLSGQPARIKAIKPRQPILIDLFRGQPVARWPDGARSAARSLNRRFSK